MFEPFFSYRAGNFREARGGVMGWGARPPLFSVGKRQKRKRNKAKKRKYFKRETIKRLSPRWPTILLSVPWPLHFEIHFAGSELLLKDIAGCCNMITKY